jgi:hypothetical protein
MMKWCNKKQELIARHFSTCGQEDLSPPQLPLVFKTLQTLAEPEDFEIEASVPTNYDCATKTNITLQWNKNNAYLEDE